MDIIDETGPDVVQRLNQDLLFRMYYRGGAALNIKSLDRLCSSESYEVDPKSQRVLCFSSLHVATSHVSPTKGSDLLDLLLGRPSAPHAQPLRGRGEHGMAHRLRAHAACEAGGQVINHLYRGASCSQSLRHIVSFTPAHCSHPCLLHAALGAGPLVRVAELHRIRVCSGVRASVQIRGSWTAKG